MTVFRQSVTEIAQICVRHGITDAIISPGLRSAPLALAFIRHQQLTSRVIVDERSAAYVALGISQQTRRPTVLICTSGTAALNYAPAVAEALHQQIPLLIFTADRPPEWIAQRDNQTIHQRHLYGAQCKASYVLPDADHPDAIWHADRMVSEATIASETRPQGPVHINVPLREPLFCTETDAQPTEPKVITSGLYTQQLSSEVWPDLLLDWQQSKNKLIVVGMNPAETYDFVSLKELSGRDDVAVLTDVTANLEPDIARLHFDMILGSDNSQLIRSLACDLLITTGGTVVSKNLKLFLRHNQPAHHWHIEPTDAVPDTYQALTRILKADESIFFDQLVSMLNRSDHKTVISSLFRKKWKEVEVSASNVLQSFLSQNSYCELSALAAIIDKLPAGSGLQLGNSGIVRLASLLTVPGGKNIRINSNRGTSGIDGTVSTAVGAALATSRMTTLITGDLAFFYDRNGLWQRDLPADLRIIVFNNGGGGIFRILDDIREQPELDDFFEVGHQISAENTVRDYDMDYLAVTSLDELDTNLETFYEYRNKPTLMEVFFDKYHNAELFLEFKEYLREIS